METALYNDAVYFWGVTSRMRGKRQTRKRKQKGGSNAYKEIKFPRTLSVSFDGKVIHGNRLKLDMTQKSPRIEWLEEPQGDSLYTYICFDPDATLPSWIHLMIVNCSTSSPHSGETTFEWYPPAPPKGTHRYIFGLFTHAYPIDTSAIKDRGNFNVREFIPKYGLTPLAGASMTVSATA